MSNVRTRYISPYADSPTSDMAVESADEDQNGSSGETPTEFPSSPPLLPQDHGMITPSSPGLPTQSYPVDSGFVSDNIMDRDEGITRAGDADDAKMQNHVDDLQDTSFAETFPGHEQFWQDITSVSMDFAPTTNSHPVDGRAQESQVVQQPSISSEQAATGGISPGNEPTPPADNANTPPGPLEVASIDLTSSAQPASENPPHAPTQYLANLYAPLAT